MLEQKNKTLSLGLLMNLIFSPIIKVFRRREITMFLSSYQSYRFEGNMKYLFLYTMNTKKWKNLLNPLWITTSREISEKMFKYNFPCLLIFPKGLISYFLSLIPKLIRTNWLISDCGVGFLHAVGKMWGSRVLNLHHGLPIKSIERPPLQKDLKVLFSNPKQWHLFREDALVVPSKWFAEVFKKAWHIDESTDILISGYPRTEFLIKGIKSKEFKGWKIGVKKTSLKYVLKKRDYAKRYIIYMPTFRNWTVTSSHRLDELSIAHLPNVWLTDKIINLKELDKLLESNDAIMFIKAHYFTVRSDIEYLKKKIEKKKIEKIKVLDPIEDVYPLLSLSDVLISDYSSVVFDYLPLNRPIIMYPYDLHEYEKKVGLLFEYSEIAPGPIAYDFNTLTNYLQEALNDTQMEKEKRLNIFKLAYESRNVIMNASKIICEYLYNRLET